MTLDAHDTQGAPPKQKQASAISTHVRELREAFDAGRTRPLAWRVEQLRALVRMVERHEGLITEALASDLGKPALEAYVAEINYVRADCEEAIAKLPGWMAPERVAVPLVVQPARGEVVREPLGVVLVIAPWNYPFQLAVAPLIGALAAGNCVIVKPSEVAPATSALLARLLPEHLDPLAVRVVTGGVRETTELLEERFDHVFYTGNGVVGRVVMTAAAKHLTPVTLELGGKSPCYVDRSADLEVSAKRIVWGKFFNAGQTCVAPDYVLAHESVHDRLLELLARAVRESYGADPKASPDYGRIVNERHHDRLTRLLDSGRVVVGGQADRASRYLAPTVLADVPPDAPVMGEEIFGPILPVLRVRDADEAIRFVNARDKPLALYVFAGDGVIADRVIERTSSGGVTVNHTWLHLGCPELPFGGVGESGMGAYHGEASFDCFSHKKSVLRKPTLLDPPLLYPPYTETKTKWIKRLL
jgi:aldehyde dehydrogenase (NAD+)